MESDQECHLILDPESAGTDLCGLLGRGGAWTLSVVLNNTTSPTDSPVESFPATLALHSPIHIAHTYFLVTTSHLCTGHPTPGQRRERTPKKGGSGGSQWSWADLQLPWLSLGGATPYDLISLCSAVFSVLCNKRITSEIRRINKTYYALKYHRRLPGVRSSLGFLHTCKEGWPAQLTPCPSF